MGLYLRQLRPDREGYRVLIKLDETEFEVGSIALGPGVGDELVWQWAIDAQIPMRIDLSAGIGTDRKDCMRMFRKTWEDLNAEPGWREEFLAAKRRRQGPV